jgi:Primase C terminal 2 (PriCT-2)/Bifunctional DNA primase/polymerase, N-terminal
MQPESAKPSPILVPEQGHLNSNLRAAMHWFGYGLQVIPIIPRNKMPAVKWDPWLEDIGPEKVYNHYKSHPDHEVGFIVGDDLIVFDADTPVAVLDLYRYEKLFAISPRLIVRTTKGEHHYFRRTSDSKAKSDSHDSTKHPERLDIKTGRAIIVLPPSTGKTILTYESESKDGLSYASQEFIDMICKHNGRSVQSQEIPRRATSNENTKYDLTKDAVILQRIDPDCGYENWLRVGMAIFHESSGSEEGYRLFDDWSQKGRKYKGSRDTEIKWNSFREDVSNPVTIGTLIMMARDVGVNVKPFMADGGDKLEIYKDKDIVPSENVPQKAESLLAKYSLLGMSSAIAKNIVNQQYVIGEIALAGQATVIYAAPNSGKTLLTFALLIQSIKQGRVDPSNVYYVNVDDTAVGLRDKAVIAEEFGLHMLAEGYRDFSSRGVGFHNR